MLDIEGTDDGSEDEPHLILYNQGSQINLYTTIRMDEYWTG